MRRTYPHLPWLPLLACATAACSTTTSIKVNPADATIFVNGEKIGQGKATVDVANGMGGEYEVRVEAKGQRTMRAKVSRQHLAVGPMAGAIGGCLGGGCVLGLCGGLAGAGLGGAGALLGVPCALVGGLPFLILGLWSFQGPDSLELDMVDRKVKTSPDTNVVLVDENKGPRGSAPAPQQGSNSDSSADTSGTEQTPESDDQSESPAMQPFDY